MTGDAILFLTAFAKVFIHGIQTRNVMGLHYKSAFLISWLMTASDFAIFTLIVLKGWPSFFPIAAGSSIGIVVSMYIHAKVFKVHGQDSDCFR